ncbi:quinone oxidoreductase family protein [Pseudazoarcus pumilus]|uniref:Quinone oxidoreductase n=1 Tax=Pseudazoarcus pumilus TaxID=2067960 RepID=A0A2I6S4V1_9RHOO|nr:quinone oxidoreductase [Pseudazoarcus pumilus]AUN94279.1 quinone oxidoreductase [Pseudazoarcus pumilus]
MSHAIRIHETGGPEVLRWEEVEVPPPGPGELRLRQHAVGLNYIDTYHRGGLYPVPSLPSGLGLEGAGVVEAVGDEVEEFAVGDRVAYAHGPLGAYAEVRNLPAERAVKLPDAISFELGAAMMLQGLTAQYLVRRTHRVEAGDTILIHAAAGGVGSIVVQWAKALGATVIGTVGSEEKAERARTLGADHVIDYSREDFVRRVGEITDGRGVRVVYDSVGRDTFLRSLDCAQRLGMVVLFGNASGAVEPFNPLLLAQKGALFLTRPILAQYIATREELDEMAADLFAVVSSGQVRIDVNQCFALREAAEAHRALEGRRTTGASVLLP